MASIQNCQNFLIILRLPLVVHYLSQLCTEHDVPVLNCTYRNLHIQTIFKRDTLCQVFFLWRNLKSYLVHSAIKFIQISHQIVKFLQNYWTFQSEMSNMRLQTLKVKDHMLQKLNIFNVRSIGKLTTINFALLKWNIYFQLKKIIIIFRIIIKI